MPELTLEALANTVLDQAAQITQLRDELRLARQGIADSLRDQFAAAHTPDAQVDVEAPPGGGS